MHISGWNHYCTAHLFHTLQHLLNGYHVQKNFKNVFNQYNARKSYLRSALQLLTWNDLLMLWHNTFNQHHLQFDKLPYNYLEYKSIWTSNYRAAIHNDDFLCCQYYWKMCQAQRNRIEVGNYTKCWLCHWTITCLIYDIKIFQLKCKISSASMKINLKQHIRKSFNQFIFEF